MAGGTGSALSSAAVATLNVSAITLEKDLLLKLVVLAILPSFQVEVKVNKGKQPKPTTLETMEGNTLTERNTILRCLCGIGLCNQLDKSPYYMLGGNATAATPIHCITLANISNWMSLADNYSSALNLEQLNTHLELHSFLANTGNITLADLSLGLQLLKDTNKQIEIIDGGYTNIQRWLKQCYAVCIKYTKDTPDVVIPELKIPVVEKKQQLPTFFYPGDEYFPPKQPSAGAAKKQQQGGKQQQQNQQQKGKDGGGNNKGQQQQQQQGKKQKQKQPKQQQQQTPANDDWDISALDIRVGKIIKVWDHEKADKLFCEQIDIGEENGPRNIASGLRPFYKQNELENQMVLVLCNLKKRNLVGFPSHGMVLCASNTDHTSVKLVTPPADSKIGERIVFDGYSDKSPEPENKIAKKKIFEKLAPDLKTTADGIVVWKDAKANTSTGIIKDCMPNAQVA